uniref:Small ribosomal subunit protein uS11c n=1 Tax=Hypertelis spergulacea TaxID=764270 RepID=A0A411L8V1_9CARY|nr:ribosomal protein S11 [Hypertelis spergulacea]
MAKKRVRRITTRIKRRVSPLVRRYRSFRLRRKRSAPLPKGLIHVQAGFNNTIVTVTDVQGRTVWWASAGTCGFKSKKRGTPFAGQTVAESVLHPLLEEGMKRADLMLKGFGRGRAGALRAIRYSGIRLDFVRDVTPLPHNGCRAPKQRRIERKNTNKKKK